MTHRISNLNAWLAIAAVVLASTGGDLLLARAMKKIGDVGELRKDRGLLAVVAMVLSSRYFLAGVGCMAVAFYSMLFGLSWNDVSLIGPATASLTFVTNAFAARIFLHEHVDGRRWAAALLVASGVVLMAL
jgi:drug/metabolite transporter (DMT)-like permease